MARRSGRLRAEVIDLSGDPGQEERVAQVVREGVEKEGVRGFARKTGLSPALVTRYVQGKVGEPTQETLEKLAIYFGVSVGWLRGEYPNTTYIRAYLQGKDVKVEIMTGLGKEATADIPAYLLDNLSDMAREILSKIEKETLP